MREAPPHLQPQHAPPHPAQPICAVSGARPAHAAAQHATMSPQGAGQTEDTFAWQMQGCSRTWHLLLGLIGNHLCALHLR